MLLFLHQFWKEYIELLLPSFRWLASHLSNDFIVLWMGTAKISGDNVVAMATETSGYLVVEGYIVVPGSQSTCSTLASHALQHPFVIWCALLAWPGFSVRQRLVLVLMSLPVLFLVEMIDVPLVLVGTASDIPVPSATTQRPLLSYWGRFLDGGGRHALSICAAILIVIVYKRIAQSRVNATDS